MDFIRNMFSNLQKKCMHTNIYKHSATVTQTVDLLQNRSSQTTVDKKCEGIKTELEFIDKLNNVDTINCSDCNHDKTNTASNETTTVNFVRELILESINSFVPKHLDKYENCSKSLVDKLDDDKINIFPTEHFIVSGIHSDNISVTDTCIDKTKDKHEPNAIPKTEAEFTDSTHNVEEHNESITSESILIDIDLDDEYYFDSKKTSYDYKGTDHFNNLKTEIINTCNDINISEPFNDPLKLNKEPSYLGAPDNDYKNVPNSEMLVSLEEFDRVLQRYSNDTEKDTHWDPNYCKYNNRNIRDPLSIDDVDEFISSLNETKPKDISSGSENFKQLSLHIDKSLCTLFAEGIKADDDVISISSDEHIELQNELYDDNNIDKISITSSDTDCSGYHSSDFEFISEGEAKLDGLIINFVPPKVEKPDSRFGRPNIIRSSNKEVPEPSNLSNSFSSFNHDIPKVVTRNEGYRHEIPEGDNYLNLFQGIYNPVLPNSEIYFLENKSVRVTGMHVEFEGLGFDMQMAEMREHDSDDELKEECQESVKKILFMYPGENRKRRRRF